MILKFYLRKAKGSILVLPGQELKGIDEKTIDECLEFNFGIDTTRQECTFLGLIDLNIKKIIDIDEERPVDEYISHEKKKKWVDHNTKTLNSTAKSKNGKYAKPDSLYLKEIIWNFVTTGLDMDEYPLFIGPKGCGKDQAARDIAIATGRKFFTVNCGTLFKPKQDLVGTVMAENGSTFVVPSEFLRNYQSPDPTLIFLNELSRIPSTAANFLLTAIDKIDPYMYIAEKGERIEKGKDVVFVAAANFGFEYTDTRNQDGALMDRFTKYDMGYLAESDEIKLILSRVQAPVESVRKLVKFANKCREAKEQVRVAVSTRQLISMSKFLEKGFTYSDVQEHIFLNLFINGSLDERDTVSKMMNSTN